MECLAEHHESIPWQAHVCVHAFPTVRQLNSAFMNTPTFSSRSKKALLALIPPLDSPTYKRYLRMGTKRSIAESSAHDRTALRQSSRTCETHTSALAAYLPRMLPVYPLTTQQHNRKHAVHAAVHMGNPVSCVARPVKATVRKDTCLHGVRWLSEHAGATVPDSSTSNSCRLRA